MKQRSSNPNQGELINDRRLSKHAIIELQIKEKKVKYSHNSATTVMMSVFPLILLPPLL